jgi:hypothetical protein
MPEALWQAWHPRLPTLPPCSGTAQQAEQTTRFSSAAGILNARRMNRVGVAHDLCGVGGTRYKATLVRFHIIGNERQDMGMCPTCPYKGRLSPSAALRCAAPPQLLLRPWC